VLLPYDDGAFDLVLSNGCLEHVRETGGDDQRSLEEIHRVLAPEGTFICSHLPNRRSYSEAAARAIGKPLQHYFHRFLYHHNYLYSEDRIRAMAASAGFSVVFLEAYGAVPRNPLSFLPPSIRDDKSFVRGIDWLDDTLAHPLASICQNFAWVGIRRT
jgi:SAM-dependent methyltransferase